VGARILSAVTNHKNRLKNVVVMVNAVYDRGFKGREGPRRCGEHHRLIGFAVELKPNRVNFERRNNLIMSDGTPHRRSSIQ
jgi:hypothetical protein